MNVFLAPTPFLASGELASVTPQWHNDILNASDKASAAEQFYRSTPGYIVGTTYVVDGVPMAAVSFLDWQPDDVTNAHYLLLAGFQAAHINDVDSIRLRRVGETGLFQLTLLLPTDCCYTYSFTTPEGPMPETTDGHERLVWLFTSHRMCPLNPHNIPRKRLSIYQGPDFSGHQVEAAMDSADTDLSHDIVRHSYGREREIWWLRAPSGTARTVVFFDGDAWLQEGLGSAAWSQAGYDANLVLMSSMEYTDREADLTDPAATVATLRDVLAYLSKAWEVTLAGSDVTLVGQSYGGLGVVGVLLTSPETASNGVCISGSFFYDAGQPMMPDLTSVGKHRRLLAQTEPSPDITLALVSGRDEPIAQQSLDFLAEAQERGLNVISFRHIRGTHDYCWWRHANFFGLDTVFGISR